MTKITLHVIDLSSLIKIIRHCYYYSLSFLGMYCC